SSLRATAILALSPADWRADTISAVKMPMMVMTTSSSISVKPPRLKSFKLTVIGQGHQSYVSRDSIIFGFADHSCGLTEKHRCSSELRTASYSDRGLCKEFGRGHSKMPVQR